MASSKTSSPVEPKLYHALIPVAFLIVSLYYVIQVADLDVHVALFTSGMVASAVAVFMLKQKWNFILDGALETIKSSMESCLILIVIGMMIGVWLKAGVVPTMIYYGLKTISPAIFLPTAMLLCSIVSLASGSSWSTAATIGIAMMGIGEGINIPAYVTAGAVISGAYMGDKMSPLSETTNLAPAMAGSTLYKHIRHMLYTTVPSYTIAFVMFIFIGLKYTSNDLDPSKINTVLETLNNNFHLSPWLLLVPVTVIAIVIFRLPAIPGIFIGLCAGAVAAMIAQKANLAEICNVAYSGFKIETGLKSMDKLLSRGGMENMMRTISLILCAVFFGGVMERSGMLQVFTRIIIKLARSTGGLITATIATSTVPNLITSDQYISIIMPGRMYRKIYRKRKLAPENLSRTLEDSGTLLSPLIPWNTCGSYMIASLSVEPWMYVPYCFFNLLNPLVAIFYGVTGIGIKKLDESGDEEVPGDEDSAFEELETA